MKYRPVTADELLDPRTVEAIHRRIERVWTCSRCPAWVFWQDDRLVIARADEVEKSPRLSGNAFALVGVYTDELRVTDLSRDLAHHVGEHSDDDRLG